MSEYFDELKEYCYFGQGNRCNETKDDYIVYLLVLDITFDFPKKKWSRIFSYLYCLCKVVHCDVPDMAS